MVKDQDREQQQKLKIQYLLNIVKSVRFRHIPFIFFCLIFNWQRTKGERKKKVHIVVCEINNESDNMNKKSLIVKFCFLYFLIELIEQYMTFDIDFVKNDCHDPRPPRPPRPPLPPLQTQLMLMKHIYNGSIFNTQKHCVFRHITNYQEIMMKFNRTD